MFFPFAKSDSIISSVPPETIPIVIIFVSIVGFTIIIERLVFFWKLKPIPQDDLKKIRELVREKKWDEAKDLLSQKTIAPASVVLQLAFDLKRRNVEYLEDDVRQEGFRQISLMEKYLTSLGTIATIAPLLGVLGTVIGIVRSFAEGAGTKGAEVGISEALVTTAMGLGVAIPAYVFYNYFSRSKEERIIELENATDLVLPYVTKQK
ncbi:MULTISPECIES: MotA/TolQ/ExbB proton channel family protein [Leptospira]|uniref:MotA/TolQ/ExbB proton channel family protein n=1 Tax=Leptospira ilyithenensis TaxID=2484901 RepID=A0A4R9LPX4_9LEPT|nr:MULTISPECIES: MotA/TolQ/ExbB proton channel family protein [Leptospira]TGN08231.1 MotA/TolQ/ExbB proton channel family protein [Leptospira ilyithenensis]